MKIQELKEKYNLSPNSYYKESPYTNRDKEQEKICWEKTKHLQEKYKKYIPPKWYGFMGLGSPLPLLWFDVLDEFTQYVIDTCPNVEIYQIKVKFGEIRYYVGNITDETQKEIDELTNVLYDEHLIY